MDIKKIKLLMMAIGLSTFTLAQGFHLGAKLGVNISEVDGRSFDQTFKIAYSVGAFSEIYFNPKWGIQPEVCWNQSNTRTSSGFNEIYPNAISDIRNVKLNYLSIPLFLNYRPAKFLTLQAGPQFGLLINQNKDLLQNGKEAFKKGDFAMVVGAQLNLVSVKVGARYQ